MSKTNASGEVASYATLPVELIREIGSKLDHAHQLASFTHICKRFYFAIGTKAVFKKDAECQRAIYNQVLTRCVRIRGYPKPAIISVMQTSRDIDNIGQCIEAYREVFPEGLRGDLCTPYATPMCEAASLGRVDIVRELIKNGIHIRNRQSLRYWSVKPRPEGLVGMLSHLGTLIKMDAGDAFALACSKGHEDVTCFIIDAGFEMRLDDVFHAVQNECFRTVEALLSNLKPSQRSKYAKVVLCQVATSNSIRSPKCYKVLLDAINKTIEDDDFKVKFLKEAIVKLLGDYADAKETKDIRWFLEDQAKPTPEIKDVLYLFNMFLDLDDGIKSRAVICEIASAACKVDEALEITRTLLSAYSSFLGASEVEYGVVIAKLLQESIQSGSVETEKYIRTWIF
ncbi:hypothetical protein F4804DRAFT_349306 [Jackrogersella minutella]|nr:hypothetical protein F4804DRAFT_349306 [Jackrogersella minutella]